MRNDERDNIESLLDNALASYSMQEPRPGLDRRVLERIHSDDAPRPVFPRWAWAIPAAACLLWAGIFGPRYVAAPKHSRLAQAAHMAAPPAIAPSRPEHPRIVERPRRRKSQPRLPQFPAPAPVTNEERALLAFVARAPKEAQEALLDTPQPGVEPIRIEEIKIQPLQSDGQ
jgi:hypothetical protein